MPHLLREKKPGEPQPDKAGEQKGEEELRKEDSKEQTTSQHKKEEMSYDVGSEGDRSDDEHKKIDQKRLDRELNQTIYITITETPTNILFYCPSTKYLNLKNGKLYKFNINLILIFFVKYRRSN